MEPNSLGYNAGIRACVESCRRQWQRTEEEHEEAEEEEEVQEVTEEENTQQVEEEEEAKIIAPDVNRYNAEISAFEKAG